MPIKIPQAPQSPRKQIRNGNGNGRTLGSAWTGVVPRRCMWVAVVHMSVYHRKTTHFYKHI